MLIGDGNGNGQKKPVGLISEKKKGLHKMSPRIDL